MKIVTIRWGYDCGCFPGNEDDGYMNVEAEYLDSADEELYIWANRSMEYETIMISREKMFDLAMHMTHYDADFDLEYGFLQKRALEYYEYETGTDPEGAISKSAYYKEIRFAVNAMNVEEEQRDAFLNEMKGKCV